MAIKVKAIAPGLHGKYREAGEVFHIPDEKAFSKKWMKRIDADGATVQEETKPGKGGKSKGGKSKDKDPAETEADAQSADAAQGDEGDVI